MTLAYIPSPTISQFSIGPATIHIYALCILMGIVLAVWITTTRWKKLGGNFDQVLDITLVSVPAGIIGARLYHIITTPERFFGPDGDWAEMFRIWNGGLGIWGGVLFGALAAWAWCRHKHYPMALLADAIAPGLLVAQAVGRLGNWFNQELYGAPTTLPWGLKLNMEGKKAELFVNSPNALDGNSKDKCDTASAAFQSEESGLVDFTGTEDEIMAGIRELVSMLPANNEDDMSYEDCTDDLNRVCADLANAAGDPAILLSNIADDNNFVEVKAAYAKDMVTGFLRLNGTTVGAVANRTELYGEDGQVAESFDCVLSAKGAEKAAAFVEFCDAFEIPVVSFTNVAGFKACKCSEKRIAKAAAKLTYAFANATVPKVNVITGKAFGSAYVAMNSKSIGADMTFAWENAQIGMMDAQLAAKIMYEGSDMQTINEKAAEYATLQSSAMAAAKRGYVDNIIAAEDTRKYVIGAFEMLFTKREDRPAKKHGTV